MRHVPSVPGLVLTAVVAAAAFALSAALPSLAGAAGLAPRSVAVVILVHGFGILAWLAVAAAVVRLVDLASAPLAAAAPARLPRLLQDLARVLVYGLALLAIVAFVFGQDVTALVATSGVMVAVIGFALRNMIADVFSGIALNIEHPYRPGDWIELESGVVGQVVEINWRATRLVTRDAIAVVVPNGLIAGSRFLNYSAPERHYRATLRFTLDHGVPVERARRVLLGAALTAEGILAEPPPEVQVEGANENGAAYVVRYWVADYGRDNPCRDAVARAVLRDLRLAGLAPAYARRSVAPPAAPSDDLADLLRQVALFDGFSGEELAELAARLRPRAVAAGEAVVRAGEPGESLFVVAEGALAVSAGEVQLDRMRPGEVFGEIALLGGGPRTATVTAVTDAVVVEVARQHLAPLLAARPEAAERLAALMAARIEANREALTRQGSAAAAPEAGRDRLGWLRGFFRRGV